MTELVIRPLASPEERLACVRLQEATWGDGFADRVPSSILMIAQEMGGIASGAFQGDQLVGFVFGVTGIRHGRLAHWSDMLAVLPSHRDRGIGFDLKLHQRDRLLPLGVQVVYWTFDPLVSRNAYLNLRRLGAVSGTYLRDLYGRSNSPLHQGIGTDRLLAEWWISEDRVRDRLAGSARDPAPDPVPATDRERTLMNPSATGPGLPRPGDSVAVPSGGTVEVVVPADIEGLRKADPELARAWRRNVRAALEAAFAAGYTATDLIRGGDLSRYVLVLGLAR